MSNRERHMDLIEEIEQSLGGTGKMPKPLKMPSPPWAKPKGKTVGRKRKRGRKSAKTKAKALGIKELPSPGTFGRIPSKQPRLVSRAKTGEYIGTVASIQVMGIAVSARGRQLTPAGQPLPSAKPAVGMPTSQQDYFLQSTAISYAAWDPKSFTLELGFVRSGAVYHFFKIPQPLWVAFQNAASKGRFFNQRIRNKFQYTKL